MPATALAVWTRPRRLAWSARRCTTHSVLPACRIVGLQPASVQYARAVTRVHRRSDHEVDGMVSCTLSGLTIWIEQRFGKRMYMQSVAGILKREGFSFKESSWPRTHQRRRAMPDVAALRFRTLHVPSFSAPAHRDRTLNRPITERQ